MVDAHDDDSMKPTSSRRAKWTARHPVLGGIVSASAVYAGGVFLFDKSPLLAMGISAIIGLVVWIGWRPGGWARQIEERSHRLDID